MKRYNAKHNGRGKNHLHEIGSDTLICGTSKEITFLHDEYLNYENGEFYLNRDLPDFPNINKAQWELKRTFCRKCLAKVIMLNVGTAIFKKGDRVISDYLCYGEGTVMETNPNGLEMKVLFDDTIGKRSSDKASWITYLVDGSFEGCSDLIKLV